MCSCTARGCRFIKDIQRINWKIACFPTVRTQLPFLTLSDARRGFSRFQKFNDSKGEFPAKRHMNFKLFKSLHPHTTPLKKRGGQKIGWVGADSFGGRLPILPTSSLPEQKILCLAAKKNNNNKQINMFGGLGHLGGLFETFEFASALQLSTALKSRTELLHSEPCPRTCLETWLLLSFNQGFGIRVRSSPALLLSGACDNHLNETTVPFESVFSK